MNQLLLPDRSASDAEKQAKKREQLVREASAWAWYRFPKHDTFRVELEALLDHPADATWIQICNVIQHMTNYHRLKLLKHYPELFQDFTMFNLMLNAFVSEDDIAEFAIAYVPRLINTDQYQQLLSSIPEKHLDAFIERSLTLLTFPLEPDKINLLFYPDVREHFIEEDTEISEESKKENSSPSLALFSSLALGSIGSYYLTKNYALTSVPALYGLYLLYQALQTDEPPSQLSEFSMWSRPHQHQASPITAYQLSRIP